jgi:redox-sensitive bicupin YhaK (pirin superfamily)
MAAMERKIEDIYSGPPIHWVGDGFRVRGYFNQIPDAMRRLSPFVMLDYGEPHEFPPTDNTRRGVGPHPHRGFETVTVAFQGSVAHHDSTGSGGVIGPGDVQWMTAGSGILHREYHEEKFARAGGTMQMMQLWVNLPKAHKMAPPRYQPITADQIAVVKLPDEAGVVRVIAGEYQGQKGPAKTFSPVSLFEVRLARGGKVDLSRPASENVALMVMKGSITLNGRAAKRNDFVLFGNEGEEIRALATEEAHLMLLAGEPIREPIVQYGPFVMNTRQEIEQAILDFNRGKFGQLSE